MTTAERLAILERMKATAEASLIEILGPETTSISQLIATGEARDEVKRLADGARVLHAHDLAGELDSRTLQFAQLGPDQLLDQLGSAWGLSWSSVARALKVSDTAIRKWRKGEAISPESLRQLARLVAFLGMVKEHGLSGDIAAWFEMRVAETSPVAAVEIYVSRPDLLFELATRRLTPHEVLDEFAPGWRDAAARQAKTVTEWSDDGPVVRLRRPR